MTLRTRGRTFRKELSLRSSRRERGNHNVIVVLNQFALPRSQGGGTRHTDLFSRLTPWRHVIVAGDRNHYTQDAYSVEDPTFHLVGVPVAGRSAARRITSWAAYALKALAYLVRQRDIVAIYGSTPQPLAPLVGIAVARLQRRPFILEVRDIWPESLVSAGAVREGSFVHRCLLLLEKYLVTSAHAIVGVTENWRGYFAGLGANPRDYFAVQNGTELKDFAVAEPRDELRRRHHISGYTAVFAGAHGPKDGLGRVLDAAHRLPDVNFLLIGAGTEKEAARRRADIEGLRNVEFRAPVAKTELPELLAACDVGVHAVTPLSVFEHGMSPNKLFDYLAAGLPIVSNAADALEGVLLDDDCGALGGPDDLATCIARVQVADEATRERWRARAQHLMAGPYSRTTAASQLTHAIERAVANYGAGRKSRRGLHTS